MVSMEGRKKGKDEIKREKDGKRWEEINLKVRKLRK